MEENKGQILLYQTVDGESRIEVVIILELKIILIFQWCYLQPLLYIPTEIRNRGEIKPPGNRCQGKFFLSQQAGNLFKGKAVNPISDRFTAYLFAYLR